MKNIKKFFIISATLLTFVTACTPSNQNQPSPSNPLPSQNNKQSSDNSPPFESNNSPSKTPQTEPPKTTSVKVALIAIEDYGKLGKKIGCDDSVVFINKTVPATEQPLNAAFTELFALNQTAVEDPVYPFNLYNIIYAMQDAGKLKFDRAIIENGVAKIYLSGEFGGLGGVCDTPRVPAQIEETAKQFSTVISAETYLNGKKVNWQEFGSQK